MLQIYTSKNQYNYSIKQIVIDYENKTYTVNYGASCRIAKKNATTKFINEKIKECEMLNFTLIN